MKKYEPEINMDKRGTEHFKEPRCTNDFIWMKNMPVNSIGKTNRNINRIK
jgi:hypothetical protein